MVKKITLLLLVITINKYFSQEICDPSDLEATVGNKNIFLSWKDINDTSIETILFEECFELCGIPGSATINHIVDNGNGGWYRFSDGEWIWYQIGSKDPRWFNKISKGQWEKH